MNPVHHADLTTGQRDSQRQIWDLPHLGKLQINFQSMPEHVRAKVDDLLPGSLWLLPRWVQCLNVQYAHSDEAGQVASVVTNYKYRYAVLYIHAAFCDFPATEQKEMLDHELIHASTAPLADLVTDFITDTIQPNNDALARLLRRQLRETVEMSTQDLAWAIRLRERETDARLSDNHRQAKHLLDILTKDVRLHVELLQPLLQALKALEADSL